jgi:hypothetical protein
MSANSKPDETIKEEQSTDELFRPNPDYGQGCTRRRILLRQRNGYVIGELEDNNHAFRVEITHNGQKVTHITGEAIRYPMTTCPGSVDLLEQLIDTPLSSDPRAFNTRADPRTFCTHLFDLAGLTLTHTQRQQDVHQYDFVVSDENDGKFAATALINGNTCFDWEIDENQIMTAGIWEGIPVQKGFNKWAMDNLTGDELEAALLLSRTIFVSNSRKVDIRPLEGSNIIAQMMPRNVCYSHQESNIDNAITLHDTHRDFSDNPEALISWSKPVRESTTR